MKIYSYLEAFKDNTPIETSYREEHNFFVTDNFFDFWRKCKEVYAKGYSKIYLSECASTDFRTTNDNKEIFYVSISEWYLPTLSNHTWQIQACDLEKFFQEIQKIVDDFWNTAYIKIYIQEIPSYKVFNGYFDK